jgi:prolipoprotein diacylglyceryltransferase
MLAGLLAWLNARGRLRPGLVASLCMGAYGLYRFAFDSFRGDLARPLLGAFSASQALGLLLAALAIAAACAARANSAK